QERLLPSDLPRSANLDLAALALASRHVAGDYFDLLPLPGDRLLVAVADVSGKGTPAALLMANLQAMLRLQAHDFGDGADLAPAPATRHVAGDCFDLLPRAGARLLGAVAGVSGRGTPAALLMANLQAMLRLQARDFGDGADRAAATARINRVVCENTEATAFI